MGSRLFSASRLSVRTRFFLLTTFSVALIAVGFIYSPTASAGLIFDSVQYDGHVKSGTTTGVESHKTTTNFPAPNTGVALPAVAPFPSAPLAQPNNLSMTYTQTTESFNGSLWPTGILTISNGISGNSFANTLDSSLNNTATLPVQLDMYVFSDTPLAANKKLLISGVGVENFGEGLPFPIASSQVISNNRGTSDDPIRIQLGMPSTTVSGFRNGFIKLHIHWGTEDYTPVIPEPTTFALISIALMGAFGCVRRQRGC